MRSRSGRGVVQISRIVAQAAELHETGIPTLDEVFGLPPAPDYGG